ncbi:hypothetical protein GN956_G25953 [Arapaima gigas]
MRCKDHGESQRQCPATPGWSGDPPVEAVRGLRGQDRRPLPPLRHGQLLAQPVPQVLLLPGAARRDRHVLLHQERHDPLQKRLHQDFTIKMSSMPVSSFLDQLQKVKLSR